MRISEPNFNTPVADRNSARVKTIVAVMLSTFEIICPAISTSHLLLATLKKWWQFDQAVQSIANSLSIVKLRLCVCEICKLLQGGT